MAVTTSVIYGDQLTLTPGLRLMDGDDNVIKDISDMLVQAKITYSLYASSQFTMQIRLGNAANFSWGVQRVQPYIKIVDEDGNNFTWNLGVFILGTPNKELGKTTITWDVDCYGKLDVLDTPVGKSYYLSSGSPYVQAVKDILTVLGETRYNISDIKAATVISQTRTWPLDDGSTTWLLVVNDLLKAINYQGIWVDRDGVYRSDPYIMSKDRTPVWVYDANIVNTIVGNERTIVRDFYKAPNRWIFYIQNPETDLPQTGAGYYEVINWDDGDTSVNARGGRTITRVTGMDAASQAELISRGDNIIENDKHVDTKVELTTGINPSHWHMDTVTYADTAIGTTEKYSVEAWELDLFSGAMKQTWRLL